MQSSGGERGQLIVVAALLIAVLFVGLALVLNGAIYAENLASRGDSSTAETMATERLTEDRLGRMVDAANYDLEETAGYDDRRSHVRANASDWDQLVGDREANRGNAYVAEVEAMTNGTRVNQSEPDHFDPANQDLLGADPLDLGEDTDWKIANDSEVRAFEMTVQRDSLKQVDPDLFTTIEDLLDTVLTGSDVFWTQFEDGDSTYRMYLLNDSDNASVAAVVTEYHGIDEVGDKIEERLGVCSAEAPDPSDNVTVRITEAELEGADGVTDCPSLETVDDGRQALYYAGTDNVYGTYSFIVDRPEDEFREALRDDYDTLIGETLETLLGGLTEDDIYYDDPANGDPYTTTALYDVTVETTYRDGRVTFTRNVSYPPTAR